MASLEAPQPRWFDGLLADIKRAFGREFPFAKINIVLQQMKFGPLPQMATQCHIHVLVTGIKKVRPIGAPQKQIRTRILVQVKVSSILVYYYLPMWLGTLSITSTMGVSNGGWEAFFTSSPRFKTM